MTILHEHYINFKKLKKTNECDKALDKGKDNPIPATHFFCALIFLFI